MDNLGAFCKQPGDDLPEETKSVAVGSLEVVRPQLMMVKERFFLNPNGGWSDTAFPKFIRFPVVSGYVLGLIGEVHKANGIPLSEVDKLRCAIHTDSHFKINGLNLDLCLHYMMQQPVFRFGLAVGIADAENNHLVMSRGGRAAYVLLTALSNLFLTYDDERTLTLNLQIFHRTHGLKISEGDFGSLSARWSTEKEYSLRR